MSLWEKIKDGLEEGLETISEKTVEMSKLAKLKWERRGIEKEIQQGLIGLGEITFQLHVAKKSGQLSQEVKGNIAKLGVLEKRLEQKNEEIELLTAKIDRKQVKGLKKDLEMGDGTIEQIVVKEDSPLSGKKLMEIKFPKAVLVGTIVRNEQVIIPDGNTILQKGDKLTLLGKKDDVEEVVNQFSNT